MDLNVEVKVTLDKFKLRWYQEQVWDAIDTGQYKRVLLIASRRSGKDLLSWNLALRQCIKKTCLVFYVLPTYSQARKTIFDAITIDGVRFLDYIPKQLIASINIAEMKIRFKNDSILQLIGGESYNTSLVGTNPYGIILSEFSVMASGDIFSFIRPILAANGGWCLINATPRGKNHLWHLYQMAKELPEWFVVTQKASEIQHIPDNILAQERAQMDECLYLQEYECFPTGTPILTPMGLKAIDKIECGDHIISHSGRVRQVTRTMSRNYKGNLIRIKSYGSNEDILCTPEHPIRVYNKTNQSYLWKPAQEIKKHDYLVFPKYNINNKPIISFELCMLIAWYITEGSGSKNLLQFSLGTKEEASRVAKYLNALGYEYSIKFTTGYQVIVNSCFLLDFMKINCGTKAYNKHIPFSLITSYEEEFFYELIRGDGCKNIHNGYTKYTYSTVSKTLAYQFQLLAHSIPGNFAAGITTRNKKNGIILGRNVNLKKSYVIQINIQKNKEVKSTYLIRAKNCIAARVISIDNILYEGMVHNLSVQYDESYIVNGRAVHNCSFERGIAGSYYGTYLDRLRLNNQIGHVPIEPGLPVYTAWDIGVNDPTTIIFFQLVPESNPTVVRIIDCYSNNNLGIDHYAKILQDKPYRYAKHFAPHDIKVREWGGGAVSRYEKARQLGIEFTLVKQIGLIEGIENVWTHFNKFWIDSEKCKSLIDALENYRREWSESTQTYGNKPAKSWACFTEDTLVLTDSGIRPIIEIEKYDKILTLQGWMSCTKSFMTKRNAAIVELIFNDGTQVKCTPDHLFLTDKGWISAENLTPNLEIQRSSMYGPNISKEISTDYINQKDIFAPSLKGCIEKYGKQLLVIFLKIVIFIIKIITLPITIYTILYAFLKMNIGLYLNQIQFSVKKQEMLQQNGTVRLKVNNGINNKQEDVKSGKNGNENLKIVNIVINYLNVLLDKVIPAKNIVTLTVKPLHCVSVKLLKEKSDVYCITVPIVHHFSLANGAIVKNCHFSDALRYLCLSLYHASPGRSSQDFERAKYEALYSNRTMFPYDPKFDRTF